ncbi:hypothetical protein, partial [Pseudomonas fluorescens]
DFQSFRKDELPQTMQFATTAGYQRVFCIGWRAEICICDSL